MAKRKRLGPALPDYLGGDTPQAATSAGLSVPKTGLSSRAPIAQVAGAAATNAAFQEVAEELARARREGRMILNLPRDTILTDYLVRDRTSVDREALEELKQSLRQRGQQTPVEVVELPQEGEDTTARYGLISGWRRLMALAELEQETGDPKYAQALALIRSPSDLSAAYVAMVEENEIRSDLSYYERARIVLRSLEAGVYEGEKQALQQLFSAASYSKRSKIKSFIPVVRALESTLRYPERISERMGLALSRALEATPEFGDELVSELKASPAPNIEAEQSLLTRALERAENRAKVENVSESLRRTELKSKPSQTEIGGVKIKTAKGRVTLSGERVDGTFTKLLEEWLRRLP